MIWELPVSMEIQGAVYEIRSDFRCILDICTAVAAPELDGRDKAEAALDIFYPNFEAMPQKCWQEAVEKCFWFIKGGDRPEGRQGPNLVDWEQDYPLLIAPINRVLGKEIRSVEYLHWWTFLSAYQEIGDCTFAQVVRIRDRLARGKVLEKQDHEWYQRNRQLVDFKMKYTQQDNETLKAWLGQ